MVEPIVHLIVRNTLMKKDNYKGLRHEASGEDHRMSLNKNKKGRKNGK